MRQEPGNHAVVLGASMAGLLAARVLTDVYRKVTVIDRDAMPDTGVHRRGVPHGRHLHILRVRGRVVLDELFPGFGEDAVRAGAQVADALGQCRWLLSGYRLRQATIGLAALLASRPFLEGQVRARVRALRGVTFLEHTDIVGLMTTAGRRVSGTQVRDQEGDLAQVPADLVVDATGRGSRTPVWLAELGYQPPAEERIDIRLGYATRTYRLRPGALGADRMILISGTPDNPRMGGVTTLEGGRYLVTLGGILGDHPPTDPAGFDAFAASLPFTDIADAMAGAQPLDNPVAFRFPASVRRRYEHLSQFPDGLLVLGDAVCSFNPIYGQGMTVAADQAMALRRLLAHSTTPAPSQFFRTIAKTVNAPWNIAVGADLAYPTVPGTRTTKIRLANAYLHRLLAAASSDATLGAAFIRAMGLLDRPEGLLRPDRALRVWWINRRHPVRAVVSGSAHPGMPPGNNNSRPVSPSSAKN